MFELEDVAFFRNKLLDLRHMSDYRQTDVYQPQLIAYTTVISDVLRLVGCDILIKSDKSGIMWDYVIAYELILRVKDSLGKGFIQCFTTQL